MKQLLWCLPLILSSSQALGCRCPRDFSLGERIDRLLDLNGLVYTATVISQREVPGEVCRFRTPRMGCVAALVNEARLEVDHVMLGSNAVQVLQYPQTPDYCGMSLQPGQQILVYATRLQNGFAETDQCRVFGPTEDEVNMVKSRLGPNPADITGEATPTELASKMLEGFWPSEGDQVRVFDTGWGNLNGDALPDLVALASVMDIATRNEHTWTLVPLIRATTGFTLYPPTSIDWCHSRSNNGIHHVTDGTVGVTCFQGSYETTVKREFRWSADQFVAVGGWEPITLGETRFAIANPIVQPVVSESVMDDGPFDLNRATTEQVIRWVMEEVGVSEALRLQTAETRREAEQLLLEFAPEKVAQWRPELERKLNGDRILTLLRTELEGTTQPAIYRRVAAWLESPVGRDVVPVWQKWHQYLGVDPSPADPPAPERAALYEQISSHTAGARFFASHQLHRYYAPQLVTQGLFMSADDLKAARADLQNQVRSATVNWREPTAELFLPTLLADLSDEDLQQFAIFTMRLG
ncbi:MAG: hypothetical protein AAGA95_16275, partial [Pseudomonadota bacterium]